MVHNQPIRCNDEVNRILSVISKKVLSVLLNVLSDWIFSWKRILSLEVKFKSKVWFYWRVFDVVP